MARLVPVTDPADPRLADYTRLRDVNLRKSLEAEHGLFVAEGEKVIRRAALTGHRARSFLMAPRWMDPLADVLDAADADVYVADESVVSAVAGFPVHRGALASMRRRPLPSVASVAASARRMLVLEDLVDHANVGSIFRSAAALGVDAIVLSPRCADPLYRRSVKVSMGAVFAVPYARMARRHDGLTDLRAAGFTLLALTPSPSAVALHEAPTSGRLALLLGAEGDGLTSRWQEEADHAVRIPMSPSARANGVDSLNVVAAAAIAAHTLVTLPAG